ncbi:MAG: hypothetical protein QOF76_3391, partial [Solirubrobacteraceae bacterium]|nr:hypothetical protein [Solirubrobacteraceae bacterium]
QLTEDYPSIIVSPRGDSGYWSDWYNGGAFGPPMYETFVIDQLIPLIDQRFRTLPRRAVFGESMGGYGVMGLAARYPDKFSAASTLSGAVDSNTPAQIAAMSASPALQGAAPDSITGPRQTQEIRFRGRNPWDLADNLRDVDLQVYTGNAMPDSSDPELVPNGIAGCALETAVRIATESFNARLNDLGIPHLFKLYDHGCHTVVLFQEEITDSLPAFERALAKPHRRPKTFDYRSIEPQFSVWDWTVQADPARALEFLQMRDARRAGVTLEGSGITRVTTPRFFKKLRQVDVVDGATTTTHAVTAGRLQLDADLGPAHTVQAYTPGAPTDTTTRRLRFKPFARVTFRRGERICMVVHGPRVHGHLTAGGHRAKGRCVARGSGPIRFRGRDAFGHRVRARLH